MLERLGIATSLDRGGSSLRVIQVRRVWAAPVVRGWSGWVASIGIVVCALFLGNAVAYAGLSSDLPSCHLLDVQRFEATARVRLEKGGHVLLPGPNRYVPCIYRVADTAADVTGVLDVAWVASRGFAVGSLVAPVWSGSAMGSTEARATLVTQVRDESPDVDKSWAAYLSDRVRLTDRWLLDLGLHYQHYEKTSSSVTQAIQSGVTFTDARNELFARKGYFPRLGLAYQPSVDQVWRLAYQNWLRPNAANTLSPVATAGIPLDDQVVLPGGELERLRFQFERELSASTFMSLFLDTKRIHNLGQPGSVLNQREEVANLDRLRNRSVLILRGSGEILEQPSAFLEGKIKSGGISINQRMSDTLSGYANYVHTESENTHRFFAGFDLPFMPRHRFTFGVNWVGPERLLLQAQAIYRTRRFIDENHSDELPAGWDATIKATWQSADKRWLVEGFATNLLKQRAATTVGLNAVWRY